MFLIHLVKHIRKEINISVKTHYLFILILNNCMVDRNTYNDIIQTFNQKFWGTYVFNIFSETC